MIGSRRWHSEPQVLTIPDRVRRGWAKWARWTSTGGNLVLTSESEKNAGLCTERHLKAHEQAQQELESGYEDLARHRAAKEKVQRAELDFERARTAAETARQKRQEGAQRAGEAAGAGPLPPSAVALLVVLAGILVGEFVFTLRAVDVLALSKPYDVLFALAMTTAMFLAANKLGVILDSLTKDSPKTARRVQVAMAVTAAGAGGVLVWALGGLRAAEVQMRGGQTGFESARQVTVPQEAVQAVTILGLALFVLLIVVEFRVAGQRAALTPGELGPRVVQVWSRVAPGLALTREQRRTQRQARIAETVCVKARQALSDSQARLYLRRAGLLVLPGRLAGVMQTQVHITRSELLRFATYVQKAEWPWRDRFTHWWKGRPDDVKHRPASEVELPDPRTGFADIQDAATNLITLIDVALGIEPRPAAAQEYPHGPLHVVPAPDLEDEQEM